MSNNFIKWSVFIVLCFIWGSSFKLMKDSITGLSGAQVAALRIFSAGLVFIPFAIFHFKKIPTPKLGLVILSAVLGNLLPAFLVAIALTKIDGSLGAIWNSLTPISVVAIGVFIFKDKIKSQKIIGVIIGFLGLALLIISPVLLGDKNISLENLGFSLLILLCTVFYGVNVNMVAHYLNHLNPFHIATVSLAFMTIPAALILWQQGFWGLDFSEQLVQNAVLSSVILGIAASAIATVLFYVLLQKAGGLFASLVTYGIPFIALLWGIWDKEKITWIQILCLCIILTGVYITNRPEKKIATLVDVAIQV